MSINRERTIVLSDSRYPATNPTSISILNPSRRRALRDSRRRCRERRTGVVPPTLNDSSPLLTSTRLLLHSALLRSAPCRAARLVSARCQAYPPFSARRTTSEMHARELPPASAPRR